MKLAAAVDSVAGYFILLWGWRRMLAAFIAGALSALALPPFYAFPLLFLTFPVFIWLMDATAADPAAGVLSRFWRGFVTGWVFGFGYFLAGLWWIGNAFLVEADLFAWMLPFAVTILPAILAAFWGVAAGFSNLFWRDDWRRLLLLAALLGMAEYLRGTLFTGFPWNAIGYAAMPAPAAMQSASLVGLYGVTVLAIPVFSLLAIRPLPTPLNGGRGGRVMAVLFSVVFIGLAIGHVGYGFWRLSASPVELRPGITFRLVQPAVPQSEKWSPQMEGSIFRTLIELSATGDLPEQPPIDSSRVDQNDARITHIVWPESSFPFILTERPDALSALAQLIPDGATLIAGALRVEPAPAGQTRESVFNSVFTIDSAGEITGATDKVHLVPFGEYLPFQNWAGRLGMDQLTHLAGDFKAGSIRRLLDAGMAGTFLPLVCYEIIFPGEAGEGETRPGFIINLTNDAWFGLTPGPYQHWQQAVIRGVEEGLPVVRAANNGISSMTDGAGRVLAKIALGRRGIADAPLPAALPATPYVVYGNIPFFAICALFFVAGVLGWRKRA